MVVASQPFYRPDAKKFFELASSGDTFKAFDVLAKNQDLVYEYNHLGQTVFHICCKRDYSDLLFLVCRCKKGDMNAKDATGRTAVMWAYEFGNENCLRVDFSYQIMLAAGAKPYIYEKSLSKTNALNPTIRGLKDKSIFVNPN